MIQIAAVLIVRDEAARLPACLHALVPAVDELVVADTGSQDDSPEIARAFTENVVSVSWSDDFAAARNAAMVHATADYVLQVDADEILQNATLARQRLQAFAAQNSESTAGLVTIESPIAASADGQVEILQAPRFFHRQRFRYAGRIHEQLVPTNEAMRTASTGLVFLHEGYALTGPSADAKVLRNLRLLETALSEEPESFHLLFQIGKTHFCAGNFTAAADALEQAAAVIPREGVGSVARISPRMITDCLTTWVYALVNQGNTFQAAQVLQRYKDLPACGVYADFTYGLAYVRLMLGDLEGAQQALVDALERGPDWEIVRGTGSFAAHYQLGLCAEGLGSLTEAAIHYAAALQAAPSHRPTIDRLFDWPLEHGRPVPVSCRRAADTSALEAGLARKTASLHKAGRAEQAHTLRLTAYGEQP